MLPSGFPSRIKRIYVGSRGIDEAFAPRSVCMTLEDDLDIGRGDMIVKPGNPPTTAQDVDVMLCWFSAHAPADREREDRPDVNAKIGAT